MDKFYECSHPTCGCEDGRCAADEANERTERPAASYVICDRCNGDGESGAVNDDGSPRKCSECRGQGRILSPTEAPNG
jgi:DnaJ-class molecular chaperone